MLSTSDAQVLRGKRGREAPDGEVLHGLDEAALDVASGGGLDGGVDQTLAPAHGMEEELLRRQPAQVAVLHETPRLWAQVVLQHHAPHYTC